MTQSPTGLVCENPAKLLNVAMEMKKVIPKRARQESRRTHSESGVPSSANWKPTKPLMRRQQ
jgi:hypothetical protein